MNGKVLLGIALTGLAAASCLAVIVLSTGLARVQDERQVTDQVAPDPEWEEIQNPYGQGYATIWRARTPHGWVVITRGSEGRPVYVPDPDHEWLTEKP